MNGEGAHVVRQARPTAPLMASNGWSGGRDATREPVQDNATQSSDNLAPMTLFHENWWLAAVTKGCFEEAVVKNGSQVIGRLPFVIEKKMCFTTLRLPLFTHVLGEVVLLLVQEYLIISVSYPQRMKGHAFSGSR